MTAGEAFRLSAASGPASTGPSSTGPASTDSGDDEATDGLTRLQRGVLDLLAGLDRAPTSLRVRTDQVEIELEWAEQAPAPVVVAAAPVPHHEPPVETDGPGRRYLTAQTVGVFYRAPEPGARPFVDVGDVIAPGRQIGLIEAMKLMIGVESDVDGRVVEMLVPDGASVEYGDRLLAYEPADG